MRRSNAKKCLLAGRSFPRTKLRKSTALSPPQDPASSKTGFLIFRNITEIRKNQIMKFSWLQSLRNFYVKLLHNYLNESIYSSIINGKID